MFHEQREGGPSMESYSESTAGESREQIIATLTPLEREQLLASLTPEEVDQFSRQELIAFLPPADRTRYINERATGSFLSETQATVPAEENLVVVEEAKELLGSESFEHTSTVWQTEMGLESATPGLQAKAHKQAEGFLTRLRRSPFVKPLWKICAGLLGAVAIGTAYAEHEQVVQETEQIPLRQAKEEVSHEMKLREEQYAVQAFREDLFAEFMHGQELTREEIGRNGEPTWTPDQANEYASIENLRGKFEYIHAHDARMHEVLQSPELFMRNYKLLADTAAQEFKHSNLLRDFGDEAIEHAVNIIPTMDIATGTHLFNQLSKDLYESIGARSVHDLMVMLADVLPATHPLRAQFEKSALLKPGNESLFGGHRDNLATFDQSAGVIRIYRKHNDTLVKLDTFPANGGKPDAVPYGSGGGTHEYVRTPDGWFRMGEVVHKKTPNWQAGWVAENAPLRWSGDKKEIEYQDTDGSWNTLTGPDAQFFGSKPFRQGERSWLYQAAWVPENGRPEPFSVEKILAANHGILPDRYAWNPFGPQALEMRDAKTKQIMSTYLHSGPEDRDPWKFLDTSHGCIHLKPEAVAAMATYLTRDALFVITSGTASDNRTTVQTEQKEKNPGVRGG